VTPPRTRQENAVRAPHPLLPEYYGEEAGRRVFVRKMFDDTALDYDRVERVMALGTGGWYRHRALQRAGLRPGMRVLDIATGTGLVAREAIKLTGDAANVIGLDPSAGMLHALRTSLGMTLVQAKSEAIPFASQQFDFISVGFALRHFSDLPLVFSEFRRMLKPGGRLLLMEMTRPENRRAEHLLKLYMRTVVPLLSRIVGRHRDTPLLYRYFWDTIEACAPPADVMATLQQAGFRRVLRHMELGIFSEYRGKA
jgi:demethylmenaquinone methyltransferase / 2-methoxy-6-polyprenyl-1,4-benzoquinol methylase